MDLNEEIKKIINIKDGMLLNSLFDEYHPVDIALEVEDLEDEELETFLSLISQENMALLFESAEDDLSARMMAY